MSIFKKLNIVRLILSVLILLFLMIPWYQLGIIFPTFTAGGKIVMDLKYIISGFAFIFVILIKFFELHVSKKAKKENVFMNALEECTDRILLSGLLIILAYNGFISVVIPIIVILRNIMMDALKKVSVDNGKMTEKSALGIGEKICLTLGVMLMLFYNLPFELWNFYFADALILIGTVLVVLNGCFYYFRAQKLIQKVN